MDRANRCSQGVNAGVLYKPCGQFWLRICLAHIPDIKYPSLMSCHNADFSLHIRIVLFCKCCHLPGQAYVILIGKRGTVNHHGAESKGQGFFHIGNVLPVVQHHAYGNQGILCHPHHDGADDVNGYLAFMELGMLDNHRLIAFLSRSEDRHKDFKAGRIKSSDAALPVLCAF